MFDIHLRRVKDRLFEPLVPVLPLAVTPDHLTATGFVLGIMACVAATSSLTAHLAFPLWLANRFFDGLDGILARSRGTASDLGGFYDLVSDFVVYSYIPIAVGYGQEMMNPHSESWVLRWLGIALVEASFHINNFMLFYCAAVAAKRREDELTSITMKPALIEGLESGVIFSAMLIWPQYVGILCWVMGGLVMVGVLQRFWYMVKTLSSSTEAVVRSKNR